MLGSFKPIIFREKDETNEGRFTWIRLEPSHWGMTMAVFKDEPTLDTPEWQAMSVVHIDPCFTNQVKITTWDEHSDSEHDDGNELILVKSIDGWKPRDFDGTEDEG